MMTNTLRSTAVLLGAIILSATLGAQSALAQTANCPCFTSELVDEWYWTLPPSADQPGQKLACVDDPGFTTFDYVDRSASGGSIYIDLMYQTTRKQARCVVDLSHVAYDSTKVKEEIPNAQALACRTEILASQVWSLLGCPNI